MFVIRPYQAEGIAAVEKEFSEGVKSTLAVLPTGSGKTVFASEIAKRHDKMGRGRTLFIAHREELINQAAATFRANGIETAVEMAAERAREAVAFGDCRAVIATVQTLQGKRLKSWPKNWFGLVITDEAHHSRADSYQYVYGHFSDSYHLGITATPERGDKRNLGAVYETVAFQYPLTRAIQEGYLVRQEAHLITTDINLKDLRIVAGDYSAGDLAELIGPHVEPLARRFAEERGVRPSVVFTPDVKSATAFASALRKLFVKADFVSGDSGQFGCSREDRRDRIDRFQKGELDVLVCCDLLTEGWDSPRVECICIARPTRIASRYAQMVGRGMRPHEGKENLLILDFDWEGDDSTKRPVRAVDLFDDSETDEAVLAAAHEEIKSRNALDVMDAIELAKGRIRKEIEIELRGIKTRFTKIVYDPVGVSKILGVRVDHPLGGDGASASDKQLDLLVKLGLKQPAGLSKREAGRWIDIMLKRRKNKLSTPSQIQFLVNLGVSLGDARLMTNKDATKAIDHKLKVRKQYASSK